jgi:hypothetical protein
VRTGELNTLYRSKLHGNFVELPSHNNPPKKKTMKKKATIYFKLITSIERKMRTTNFKF